MSYSYIYQSAQKITLGWGDEAKETPFGGLTWSGHFSGVATYEGALDRVAVLENELAGARVERDVKLVELGDLNRQAHYGLLGTPGWGDDCSLMARWGYIRRSDRSSGLTRSSNAQSKFVVSGEGI
jgi:hypothetical protein